MSDAPSQRTQVKRLPDRGKYDEETVYSILDEAYLAHVGIVEDGQPIVIPTLFARDGNSVLIHGSPASRTLRNAKQDGIPMCLTVTLVDGFVIARSGFHHSMNYRSVVVLGDAVPIVDESERWEALDLIVESLVPGQGEFVRPMTSKEVKGTMVLRLPLDEVSAKVRTGPPGDDEADYALPIWAGVIPITEVYGEPIPDPALEHDIAVPAHLEHYQRPAELGGEGHP